MNQCISVHPSIPELKGISLLIHVTNGLCEEDAGIVTGLHLEHNEGAASCAVPEAVIAG